MITLWLCFPEHILKNTTYEENFNSNGKYWLYILLTENRQQNMRIIDTTITTGWDI